MGSRKKASFMTSTNVLMVIIVALVGGTVFLGMGNQFAQGPLATARDQICKYVPFLCGAQPSESDYDLAKMSWEQLACAISVVSGSDDSCYKSTSTPYSDPEGEGGGGVPFGEGGITSGGGGAGIVARQVDDPDLTGEDDQQVSDYYKDLPELICDTSKSTGEKICTVRDFQLPQDIAAVEKWIKGHGDPKFLVYWEQFPREEEDAWSGFWLWTDNVFDITLIGWTAGRALKLGKSVIKIGSESISKAVSRKLGGLRTAGKQLELFPKSKLTQLKSWGSEVYKNMDPANKQKLLSMGIKAEGVAVVGAVLDSLEGKYVHQDKSLLIKSPFEDPEPLEVEGAGHVFLSEEAKKFYLVSPCKADLTVKNSMIKCGTYRYSDDFGYSRCDDVGEGDLKIRDTKAHEIGFCSNDIVENFKSEEEKKHARLIKEMDTREDFVIFRWTDDEFMVRDPMKGIEYYFSRRKEERTGYLKTSIPGVHINIPTSKYKYNITIATLDRMVYTDSGGNERKFDFEDGSYSEDGFEMEVSSDDCEMQRRIPSKCKIEVEVNGDLPEDCGYCEDLKEYFDDLKIFRLDYDTEKMEAENESTGEKVTIWANYSSVLMYYKSGKTGIVFSNGDEDSIADVVTMETGEDDGFFTNLWKSVGIASKWGEKQPKVSLYDTDFPDNDGKMDIINVRDCVVTGQIVDVKKDKDDPEYERNFCFADETLGTRVAENFIWVSGGIGCLAGGLAGIPGGPVGFVAGCTRGVKVGLAVGAVGQSGYAVYQRVKGVPNLWPGN